MAIICDICGANVTPDEGEEFESYENINLNGGMCLCMTCLSAVGEYVETKECKDMCKKYGRAFIGGV